MTYTVSSGTLNCTIPILYYCIPSLFALTAVRSYYMSDLVTMVIPSVATFDVLSQFHLTVYVAYLKRVFICSLPMLYVCESCLKYIKSCNILQRHLVSYYWLQCLSRYSAAANAVAASFHYNAALPRRPHYTLHSVCLSVCHMPTVNSKMENRSTFKLTEEATHIAGN